MSGLAAFGLLGWAVSSLLLWATGAAKAAARKMNHPDGWPCAVAGGLLGLVILAVASYPWRAQRY